MVAFAHGIGGVILSCLRSIAFSRFNFWVYPPLLFVLVVIGILGVDSSLAWGFLCLSWYSVMVRGCGPTLICDIRLSGVLPPSSFTQLTDFVAVYVRTRIFFSLFLNKFLRGASSALFSLFKIILNWQDRHVKIKQFYFWFLLNYSDFRICRAGGCYFIIDISYCKLILFILNSSDMGVLRWRPYGLSYKLYGAVAAYQRETYFGLSQPKQRSLLRLGMLYYDWRTMPQSAESAIVVIVKYIVCAFHTCNALRSIGSGRLLCLSGISLTKHSLFIQGC